MKNSEVAQILNSIADMLELQGIQWKPQAYRKAAQAIETLSESIEDIFHRGELTEIPGVGEHIAAKIEEYLKTGKLPYYEKLKKEVKVDLEELNQIPSLGPKKIKILYQKLKVKDLADLEHAIRKHRVQKLHGFGEKTEKMLEEGIQFVKTKPKRFLYAAALPIVNKIITDLRVLPYVHAAEIAGSFRRGKETVGDLDILVVSPKPENVMKQFTTMSDVKEILAKGLTKSSVRLGSGLQIDLRVVGDKEFGSAMNYFIGSKEHNIELRKLALSKGYTLSEYGLFTLKGKKWVAGKTENDIYSKLGMQYIEPELRENLGEIAAAQKQALPTLVNLKDIHGIFHNHSTWSDGAH
ncbi:DNA polymerase III, partial [Candidatus Woesearchaeota archaeon]|nr:DNA polymerase III [Candidatus Woesearchaeota archaeon]